MQTGEIVKIKNAAGILEVELRNKLDIADVARKGIGEFKRLRVETHRSSGGKLIITLYDGDNNSDIIYIISTDLFETPEIFEGLLHGTEKDVYETILN